MGVVRTGALAGGGEEDTGGEGVDIDGIGVGDEGEEFDTGEMKGDGGGNVEAAETGRCSTINSRFSSVLLPLPSANFALLNNCPFS